MGTRARCHHPFFPPPRLPARLAPTRSPPAPLDPPPPSPTPKPADVMRYLLDHLGELGSVADQTLEQLGMLTGGWMGAGGGGDSPPCQPLHLPGCDGAGAAW